MPSTSFIPVGDHCATAMLLNDLHLRTSSFPFDWATSDIHTVLGILEHVIEYGDNIIYTKFYSDYITCTGAECENKYGFTFPHRKNKHEKDCTNNEEETDTFENKMTRRFIRLSRNIRNSWLVYVTRFEVVKFNEIKQFVIKYNLKMLIIHGDKTILDENVGMIRTVFFEYPKDRFPGYDYTNHRPFVKSILSAFME
jgi:hypothetical protein